MSKFMKDVYKRNKNLSVLLVTLVSGTLLLGGLYVVDMIQKDTRNKNTCTVELHKYTNINAFDVEGLTSEEIDKYLEEYRENEGKKEGN